MSKSLIALLQESNEIASMLIELGGEITAEAEERLKTNEDLTRTKVDAYGAVMDVLKSRATLAENRIREWQNMRNACDASIDRLLERISFFMSAKEIKEISGQQFGFRLQMNPHKCVIDNEDLLPGMFVTTEQPPPIKKIDKKYIIDTIKKGQTVPGAHLEQTNRVVQTIAKTQIGDT